MKEHPFHAFIDLINFDQSMQEIQAQIDALKKQLTSNLETQSQMVIELEHVKKNVHETRKLVDAQELEMKTLDEREKEAKQRLDDSSNQKEYYAIKSEIQQLKRSQATVESNLIAAWDQLTNSEKEYAEKKKLYDVRQEQIEAQITQLQQGIQLKEQEIQARIGDRAAKKSVVPEEWLHKYEMMKTRVLDPVVEMVQGACGACFYSLSHQDLMKLKLGALIQCKNCFRLIYCREVMDQQPVESA